MPKYKVHLQLQEEASILCQQIMGIFIWLPQTEKEKVLQYANQLLQKQKEG